MNIAVKSEMDSRPLVYPLLRALHNYGTVLLITNNYYCRRLWEENSDCFRGITVVVSEDQTGDEIVREYGYAEGDFDFVIFDNMGASDFDYCFYAMGSRQDEMFELEVQEVLESDSVRDYWFVQFGKPVNKPAPKASEEKREKKPKEKSKGNEVPEGYDPAEKFQSRIEYGNIKAKQRPITNVPFPSFQDIELVEGQHKFYDVNANLISLFYQVFGSQLGVDEMQFRKEVRAKDESSGYIRTTTSGKK